MLRLIASVVLGYIAMAIIVLLAFSLVLAAPDFAYEKDSFTVTPGWIVYTLIASFIAALVGGYVAARVARKRRGAAVLAVVVIIFGLANAGVNLMRERPADNESAAGLTIKERANRSVQPIAYSFAVPFISAVGIMLGGRCRRVTPGSA